MNCTLIGLALLGLPSPTPVDRTGLGEGLGVHMCTTTNLTTGADSTYAWSCEN